MLTGTTHRWDSKCKSSNIVLESDLKQLHDYCIEIKALEYASCVKNCVCQHSPLYCHFVSKSLHITICLHLWAWKQMISPNIVHETISLIMCPLNIVWKTTAFCKISKRLFRYSHYVSRASCCNVLKSLKAISLPYISILFQFVLWAFVRSGGNYFHA